MVDKPRPINISGGGQGVRNMLVWLRKPPPGWARRRDSTSRCLFIWHPLPTADLPPPFEWALPPPPTPPQHHGKPRTDSCNFPMLYCCVRHPHLSWRLIRANTAAMLSLQDVSVSSPAAPPAVFPYKSRIPPNCAHPWPSPITLIYHLQVQYRPRTHMTLFLVKLHDISDNETTR